MKKIFKGDRVLLTIVIILVIFSLLVVYSASQYRGDSYKMEWKDVLFVVIGFAGLTATYLMPYRWYSMLAHPIFWTFLLITLATPGRDNLWIPGISFSLFEIMKIGLVMVLARELGNNMRQRILPISGNKEENKKILLTRTVWVLVPIMAAIIASVWRIGNSTTLIIAITTMLMLYMGLVKWSDLFVIVGSVALVGLGLMAFGVGRGKTGANRFGEWQPNMFTAHTITRTTATDSDTTSITLYNSPTEHEQNVAAKMAIASGRIFGKGPGMSTLRPELSRAESDFAYAFIIEEYGLVGGLLVLFLFTCFFYRAMLIFRLCKTGQPALLVLGLAAMITAQALLHMGVSVSLLPNTGQQLPLISKGGSSVICTLTAIGMILGISRQMKNNKL